VIATTLDPDGRRVVLTDEAWGHIKQRHPETSQYVGEIMRAVREPDVRVAGPKPDEEWFFVEWSGPGRWLQVVVHYEHGEGRVKTAFPRQSL
jgi:hypothetical protein